LQPNPDKAPIKNAPKYPLPFFFSASILDENLPGIAISKSPNIEKPRIAKMMAIGTPTIGFCVKLPNETPSIDERTPSEA